MSVPVKCTMYFSSYSSNLFYCTFKSTIKKLTIINNNKSGIITFSSFQHFSDSTVSFFVRFQCLNLDQIKKLRQHFLSC